ncbi:amidohydrolase [Nocardia sp. NPDC088792]|uniref:amidohydrolase n=1 Tax=Nocardia sp. NPDC088792 TaxID=3364332 RepID=UPI0037FF38CF
MCDGCEPLPWFRADRFTRRDALRFAGALTATAGLTAALRPATAAAEPRALDPAPASVRAVINGTIVTMDPAQPDTTAMLLEGDRIALLGTDSEVQDALRQRGGTEVTDLGGQVATPGFIDPHGHFLGIGVGTLTANLAAPPLGSVDSIAEVLDRLRTQAATHPGIGDLVWVLGQQFDDTGIRERRFPTLAELDATVPDRPLLVVHDSGHLAMVNSRGLAKLGITAATPDPAGGKYGRNPDGTPNGILYETAASATLNSALPTLDPTALLGVLDAATSAALSVGVTTALDAAATPALVTAYNALAQVRYLQVRVGLWVNGDTLQALRTAADKAPNRAPWVQTLGVKGFADGSIQGWTAALTEPYHTFPEGGPPQGPAGRLRSSVAELTDLIVEAFGRNLPAAIHANGDAAADAVIAATRAAREKTGSTVPVLMQHCQVLRDDQIAALAPLGIAASVFARHIYVWGDRHVELFLGPERAARMDPARSLIDHGVSVTLHNDAPVTPLHPLLTMRDAVERRTASGRVLGADERITPTEALAAYTSEAARQHGLADRGRLAPGLLADFTVLDADPRSADLGAIQVQQTWVGGVRRK